MHLMSCPLSTTNVSTFRAVDDENLENLDSARFRERKYLVFQSNLEELLCVCRYCAGPCQVLPPTEIGTCVEYETKCEGEQCGKTYKWQSQPYTNKMPLGNLILAAAAFFTACSPKRLLDCLHYAGIAVFSRTTYDKVQTAYLVPAVRQVWAQCQQRLFQARADRPVKLAGDGRCDSPGHCAKFRSYTLMDAQTSEVLHSELIQVRQTIIKMILTITQC